MVYKQVHLLSFSITSTTSGDDYKVDVIAECRINYCWTKLCLFLDVRSEDHRSRSPCTSNSWRDSVPAGKAVLSRARFPQLSVQFSVQSEITALAVRNLSSQCKNLSSPWKNVVTHHSVAMRHRTGNIRMSQCGIKVWQYGDFPCDIPITHFQFHRFHAYYIQHVRLSFYARLSFFRPFKLVSLFTSRHAWMINRSNTLYFEGPIQYGGDWVSSSSQLTQ